MADKNNKTPGNAAGSYYVDDGCIGCGLCVSTAPEIFELGAGDKAYVKKQPDASELEAANTALDSCPVSSIGNDG